MNVSRANCANDKANAKCHKNADFDHFGQTFVCGWKTREESIAPATQTPRPVSLRRRLLLILKGASRSHAHMLTLLLPGGAAQLADTFITWKHGGEKENFDVLRRWQEEATPWQISETRVLI